MIEILLAHRTLPAHALQTAMSAAAATGLVDPQVVLIDARRHHDLDGDANELVVPIGAWSCYDRPAPSLVGCDALLTGSEG